MSQFLRDGIRHGFGNQRFPAARRAIQQHPFRSAELVFGEQVGMQERQLDRIPHLLQFFLKPADMVIVDIRHFLQHQFLRFRLRQLLNDTAGTRIVQ